MITPYYHNAEHDITVYCGDCAEVMPELEAGSIDAVITDPPYGLDKKWTGGTWFTKGVYANGITWDQPVDNDFIVSLTKYDTCIIWGGNYYALPPARCWLMWDKPDIFHTMGQFELAWTNLDKPTNKMIHSCHSWHREHPTEKPLKLMTWCIELYTQPNDLILDPFLGSGTTAVAAYQTGRRCIGIEISEDYCDIAVKRIKEAVAQKTIALEV